MFHDEWDEQVPGDLRVYNEAPALLPISFTKQAYDTAMQVADCTTLSCISIADINPECPLCSHDDLDPV
jgi:hypothetical protein